MEVSNELLYERRFFIFIFCSSGGRPSVSVRGEKQIKISSSSAISADVLLYFDFNLKFKTRSRGYSKALKQLFMN